MAKIVPVSLVLCSNHLFFNPLAQLLAIAKELLQCQRILQFILQLQ